MTDPVHETLAAREARSVAPAPAEDAETLAAELRRLADEAKILARAELAFQKSRAAYAGAETRTIAALVAVALVLVFFALMALVVGTVIALGPLIGRWAAMAVVTLALGLVAAACAWMARGRARRMMAIVAGRTDSDGGAF